jgi:spartin
MSSIHDPRLLYSINNILAFHIQNGEETELTPSGPQTLSLLMVPTAASTTQTGGTEGPVEEDFYLHLHLPPELDLALPATTQIYHQPPNSYLIPRWDLGPDAGAFIRIQFPGIGTGPDKVTQEDIDTFETILAQCTAFLERAPPPKEHAPYNPASYAPGEGYVSSGQATSSDAHGKIVLVDEENGSVVGEMEGYQVVEQPGVKPGSKSKRPLSVPE